MSDNSLSGLELCLSLLIYYNFAFQQSDELISIKRRHRPDWLLNSFLDVSHVPGVDEGGMPLNVAEERITNFWKQPVSSWKGIS